MSDLHAPAARSSTCRAPTSGRSRRRSPSPADAPDPRPRGRRRPRRQAGGPRGGVRRGRRPATYGRREVTIRVNGARHRVARRRPRRGRQAGPGRDRGAQGQQRRRGPRARRRAWRRPVLLGTPPSGRWSRRGRDAPLRADRRRDPRLHRARDGHQRPRQGAVRRARARSAAAADRAGAGAAGRPGHGQGDPRRRLQRREGRRRLPGRVPPGPGDGLRRQDPDPPRSGRRRQRGVRAE